MNVYVEQNLGVKLFAVVTRDKNDKAVVTIAKDRPKKKRGVEDIVALPSKEMTRVLSDVEKNDFRVKVELKFSYRRQDVETETTYGVFLKPANGE